MTASMIFSRALLLKEGNFVARLLFSSWNDDHVIVCYGSSSMDSCSHVYLASPRVSGGTISLHLGRDIVKCVGITLATCCYHLSSGRHRMTPSTTGWNGGKARKLVVIVKVIFEDNVDDIPSSTKNLRNSLVIVCAVQRG